MAEDTIDATIEHYKMEAGPCRTKDLKLIGAEGWRPTLHLPLIQMYGIDTDVARHLVESYGNRAWTVASLTEMTGDRWPVRGIRLSKMYRYIEGEVKYAVRYEYAETAIDVLARRTRYYLIYPCGLTIRLAFLNAQAALEALPRVIDLMAAELNWSRARKNQEWNSTILYLKTMGLPEKLSKLTRSQVERGDVAKFDNREDYRRYARHDGPTALQN
jgi:glycerol-3-phosphate dehydrogenase